jgi:hypothetical protein
MLGASSSEDDDDESTNYRSTSTDKDEFISDSLLAQPVPDARANRGSSFRSLRSVSPTGSDVSSGNSPNKAITNGGIVHRNSSLRSPQRSSEGNNGSIPTSVPQYSRRTVSQTGSLSPSPSIRSTLSEKRPAKACSLVSINESCPTDGSVKSETDR